MSVVGVIAIASLLLASVPTHPNEGNEKFLTVKVVESRGGTMGAGDCLIIIVDEKGQQETIELEKLTKKTTISNAVQINKTLNSIAEKGYTLSATSIGGDVYVIYTIYTFVKK